VAEVAIGAVVYEQAHRPMRIRTAFHIAHDKRRLSRRTDIKPGVGSKHFNP
jgi:hypothetical protein